MIVLDVLRTCWKLRRSPGFPLLVIPRGLPQPVRTDAHALTQQWARDWGVTQGLSVYKVFPNGLLKLIGLQPKKVVVTFQNRTVELQPSYPNFIERHHVPYPLPDRYILAKPVTA